MTAPEVFDKATHFTNLMRASGADTKFGRECLVLPSITPGMKTRANRYPAGTKQSILDIRNAVLPAFSLTGAMRVTAARMDTDYLILTARGYPDSMIKANPILVNEPGKSHARLWTAGKDIGFNLEIKPIGAAILYFTELELSIIKRPQQEGLIKLEVVTKTLEVNPDFAIDATDCVLSCLSAALSRKYAIPKN